MVAIEIHTKIILCYPEKQDLGDKKALPKLFLLKRAYFVVQNLSKLYKLPEKSPIQPAIEPVDNTLNDEANPLHLDQTLH